MSSVWIDDMDTVIKFDTRSTCEAEYNHTSHVAQWQCRYERTLQSQVTKFVCICLELHTENTLQIRGVCSRIHIVTENVYVEHSAQFSFQTINFH